MTELTHESQKLDPSAILSLFTFDATPLNGPVLHFVRGSEAGGPVVFDGIEYQPSDVEFEGLEVSGVGSMPTPTIRISNTDNIIQALVNSYGDLNGVILRRIRTHYRFLDSQPDADPTARYGPDIFAFERKVTDTADLIEWELSSAFDQEGKMIPGRVVIAGTCMWRYRTWNPDAQAFEYGKAQCPYTGSQYFDVNNLPVAGAAQDEPARNLDCCRKRFGSDQPLPFGGFPGARRI